MITVKNENCPFYSKEEREKWHRKRGIEDPLGKVVVEDMEDPAPYKAPDPQPVEIIKSVIEEEPKEEGEQDGMTKEQRYRARNKEKLAARARERRAKK